MTMLRKFAIATGLCATAALGTGTAMAQTTDAYHTIQVFPVVVDTASFKQRFTFRNPNLATAVISVTYYPAVGTSQGVALNCGSFTVAGAADRTFTGLRNMCATLAAGAQFGYLYTYETSAANLPYAGFSRVANPQGNGFSVEAFSASQFTSADTVVTGIRRQVATASNPTYQTNCFVANLNDVSPPATPVTTSTYVSVYNSAGVQVGATTMFDMVPGQMNRLSDVFSVVGAPAGDYLDARARFEESGIGEPGLFAFCTVQDNTSFGADFRIAKQEFSGGGSNIGVGPQDDYNVRNARPAYDMNMSGGVTRPFEIGSGDVNHANTHVVYFHHPDFVQCEVIDPTTGVRALAAYGLEMRMIGQDGSTVIAGGNESYGFGQVYLGDKADRNEGANTRYTIEVESTAVNHTSTRPYYLHCQSGSGHTLGDIVRYKEAIDRF